MKFLKFFILTSVIIFLLDSCISNCDEGSGIVKESERDISNVTEIELSGTAQVFLTQGDTEQLVVETDDNLISQIITKQDGNNLQIFEKNCVHASVLNVYITVIDLDKIKVSGAGELICNTKFETSELILNVDGAGDINMILEVENLTTEISGSGDIILSGIVQNNNVFIDGAGRLSAFNLISSSTEAKVEGSGDCEILVNNSLEAIISGSGDLKYKGNPQKISTEVKGAGELIRK